MKEEEAEERSTFPSRVRRESKAGLEASVVLYNGYERATRARKTQLQQRRVHGRFLLQQPQLGVTSLLPSSGVWMEQRGRSGASWLRGVCHQSTATAAVENKELTDYIYI